MDFSTDFDRDESVGNGGITRIAHVPNGPEDPTGWERTPPPTVSDDDHVLFDTEQVNAGGLYAQFFQNSVLTNTGGRKVFGVDTNMIQGGGMTEGCEKDMRDVRLVSDDLPPDTLWRMSRPFSRSQSRCFSVSRLSCWALPLARAISTFTRPPL